MFKRSIGFAVLAVAVLASGGCTLRSVSISGYDDHHYRHRPVHRPVHVTYVETHGRHRQVSYNGHHGHHGQATITVRRHAY